MRWSTEIVPAPLVSRKRRIEVQTRCSGQAPGYTKTWIVAIMASSGRVARRVARPRTRRVEQPSSKVVARTLATSGGSTGTWYSSRNRASVVSQLDSLINPALRKTPATARRNRSWWRDSGNPASRRAQLAALGPESVAGVPVEAVVMRPPSPRALLERHGDDEPLVEER